MIILHELRGDADLRKRLPVIALEEETAVVTEDLGLQNKHTGQRSLNCVHSEEPLTQHPEEVLPIAVLA